jgi:hypothetical protein
MPDGVTITCPEHEKTTSFDDYLFMSVQYKQTHLSKFDEDDYGILRVGR